MTRWMHRVLALGILAGATLLASAGTASGSLEVNGKVYKITHAYALQVEDWTDKTKKATMLLLSDRALPEKILNEKVDTFDLRDAGMNGLKMEFYSGGENYSMMIVGAGVEGSYSSSGTFDASQFTTNEATKIAGKLADKKSFGETEMNYDVTFDSEVTVSKPKVKPSAEEMKAAQSAASAKAYVAFSNAVRKGDLDAIRAGVVPERTKMMDTPEFKGMLGMIQMMMPSDIQVVKASEDGDTAQLELTGKDDDKDKEGVATLRKVGGKWLVENESWK